MAVTFSNLVYLGIGFVLGGAAGHFVNYVRGLAVRTSDLERMVEHMDDERNPDE